MNETQKRVLIEAEFYFYLAGYPELFVVPTTKSCTWLPALSVATLEGFNLKVRAYLREGSLVERPQTAIKPLVIIPG